jgi:hypothetical protein
MILLDTNVISETMRKRPDPAVSSWLLLHPRAEMWTTSIVIAELLSGIETMPIGRKQRVLREAVEEMIAEDFHGQVLSFNLAAARHFARIRAARLQAGRPIPDIDAQIAAIARAHGAMVATKNIDDFSDCGIDLVNPWSGETAKVKWPTPSLLPSRFSPPGG